MKIKNIYTTNDPKIQATWNVVAAEESLMYIDIPSELVDTHIKFAHDMLRIQFPFLIGNLFCFANTPDREDVDIIVMDAPDDGTVPDSEEVTNYKDLIDGKVPVIEVSKSEQGNISIQ